MGTHSNIAAGYGFDDLDGTGMDAAGGHDPRLAVHPDALVARLDAGMGGDLTRAAFLAWLQGRMDAAPDFRAKSAARGTRDAVERAEGWSPRASLVWEPEYGLASALLIVPPGATALRRYRDSLDRLTLIVRHGVTDSEARVEPIPLGLEPCFDQWVDARDGRAIVFDAASIAGDDPDRPGCLASFGDGAVKTLTGLESAQAAREHMRLRVPPSVGLFAEWCGLLAAPGLGRRLVPLLYTWWG